jgi:hypothetical protein
MKKYKWLIITGIVVLSILSWRAVYSAKSDLEKAVMSERPSGVTSFIYSNLSNDAIVLFNDEDALSAAHFHKSISGWKVRNKSNTAINPTFQNKPAVSLP